MDSRVKRGKSGAVRGKAHRGNPRLSSPPTKRNSHRSRPATKTPLTSPDVKTHRQTKFERLAFNDDGTPRASKFGGTDIERASDNAAAELGFQFDKAQVYVALVMNGSYTVVDRFLAPNTMIYLDGIQHDLRLDAVQQDFIQKVALESLGYKVVRLKDKDLKRDPLGTVRGILYAV